jgi:hypothetical protein
MKFSLLTTILLLGFCNAQAQVDTSKIAFPPGTTPEQKAAYQKYFRNIDHPAAYYSLPVAKQMQYDINMHRAKSQKTKGWLLLGLGAAFTGIGALVEPSDNDATDIIFYCAGATCAVLSIPCFVTSGKRKRQAEMIIASAPSPTSFLRFAPQLGMRVSL